MFICPSCRAEQIKGTLFCSECGADLEAPAVPTFSLNEADAPPLAPPPPVSPWQNRDLAPDGDYNAAPIAPSRPAAYNPNYNPAPANNTSPYGFPPDEDYDSLPPSSYNPPPYIPPSPAPKPPVPAYNPNPGGFTMPPKPPKPPIPAARSAIRDDLRMIVLNTGRVLEFPDRDTVIIGRYDAVTGEKPDIDLTPDNGVELGVSRRHVCITFRDGAPYLTDLGAKNYTFLNRRQMSKGQPYPLQNGDEVRLGNVILKVLYDPDGLL
jgi:pSer/pThr/pTyr-binding forkhead associated (FHA) protein